MNNIVGLILAGGKSKRMGRDKSKLEFDGEPLLQRIINEHRKIVDQVYVIGKSRIDAENVTGIPDDLENLGPIGGLFTGMKMINADWYLISPCDMPFLKHTDLKKIIIECEKQEVDAIIAESKNGIEPLVAVYGKSVFPLIEKNIKNGMFAVRKLYKQIRVKYLYFDEKIFEKNIFFNINYPEDYIRALQLK